MMENTQKARSIVAFDVAKNKLDICAAIALKAPNLVCNNRRSIRKLLKNLKNKAKENGLPDLFVIVEATGGYERKVLDICVEMEIEGHRSHPNKVYHFAKGRGILAKTDEIDARTLFAYARDTPDLRLYQKLRPVEEQLKALMVRRDELMDLRIAENNRQETARDKEVRKSIKSSLRHFDKQIRTIEEKIRLLVAQDVELKRKSDLIKSFKGAGDWIAFAALAYMPELGEISRGQAAALAGLAPYNDDSGKRKGRRRIRGGRKIFRDKLYMGAVSAYSYNSKMREYADRIIARGKEKMLAITAIMRKMVVIFNAILKSGEPWKGASA